MWAISQSETLPRRQVTDKCAKRGAWIGVNSTVLQDVVIGEFAIVGAMSLVNRSLSAGVRAFGIPCRPAGG